MKRTIHRITKAHPLLAIAGWVGVSLILLGYGLNSLHIVESGDSFYLTLNLLGASCLLIEAHLHHDAPLTVLNLIWTLIAITGLVRFFIST